MSEVNIPAVHPGRAGERPVVAMTVELERAIVAKLRAAAAERDMPVTSLIRELLEVIASDGLALKLHHPALSSAQARCVAAGNAPS